MRTVVLFISILILSQPVPSHSQLDIKSLAPVLMASSPSEFMDLLLIVINRPEQIDLVEDIFISGYKLLHEEPVLNPVIMSEVVDWTLDELPHLLQNETVKNIYHIFVNEINKANLSIVNTSSIDAAMNDVFAQMDWLGMILKMAGNISKPLLNGYGIQPNVTKLLVPKLIGSLEIAIKTYLQPLLPSLIKQVNAYKPDLGGNAPTTDPVLSTKTPSFDNQTVSIITLLQELKGNYSAKVSLARQYLVNNSDLVNKTKTIALSALPLLFEPPTLNASIQRLLLSWVFNKIPPFLKNEGLSRGYHYLANTMNKANLTGLNSSNSHEFVKGILGQINLIDVAGKFATEIAIPLVIKIGIKPDFAKYVIPKAIEEIGDLFSKYGTRLMMKIITQFNRVDIENLNDANYANAVLSDMFRSVIVGEILPNILSEPTLKMVVVSLSRIPSIQQLEKIVLSLVPLIKPLTLINPNITVHLLHWAANYMPILVKNPLVTTALNIIVSEINKVNLSIINSTDDDAIVIEMWRQIDVIHVVGNIATSVIIPWSVQSGLKREVAMHLIPFLTDNIEELVKIDVVNLIHILIQEMNRVNITDLDVCNPGEFVSSYLTRLDVRPVVSGLISQPHIKGLLISTIMKSPLVVLDLGKVLLSSVNMSEVLSLPQDARSHSQKCYDGFMSFLENIFKDGKVTGKENWAVRMLDAYGKPLTGTLIGNVHFIGSFDECLSIGDISDAPKTRYCRANFRVPETLVTTLVGNVSTYGVPFTITWGMCVVRDCFSEDIPALFRLGLLDSFGLKPESVVCSDEKPALSNDQPTIALLSVACVIAAIVVFATVINGLTRKKGQLRPSSYKQNVHINQAFADTSGANGWSPVVKELQNGSFIRQNNDAETGSNTNLTESIDGDDEEGFFNRFIRSISLFTGLRTLLSFERDPEEISCLYGIRALTVLWICAGNAYLFNAIWGGVTDVAVIANPLEAVGFLQRFTFQFVLSGTLATDTFLVLSGFIMTHRLLAYISKDESMKISTVLLYYVRRYIRLTPVYIIILIGYATSYPYLGDGPTWPATLELADSCRTRWWYHILYVNNIVDVQGHIPFVQCMPWSWFNAVVMQLNIATPILLVLFLASFKLGFTIVILLMLGGITATGVKEHHYGGDLLSSLTDNGNYWNNVFIAPWCRVSSYSVGVILGFILFVRRRQKIDGLIACVGWIVSTLVGVCLIFITYLKYMKNAKDWTLQEQAAHEALSRPVWACCVAWAIFACHNYGGGIINTFLSWKGFIPLSKLSYTMYLLNPIVVALYMFSRRSLTYVSDIDMIFLISSFYIVTALCALICSALFETPLISLMNSFRRKDSDKFMKED